MMQLKRTTSVRWRVRRKRVLQHASSVFSAVDFGDTFSSALSGDCVRGFFAAVIRWPHLPPRPRRAPRALRARTRTRHQPPFRALWRRTRAGAAVVLHCFVSPEGWFRIRMAFVKTLIRSQRMYFRAFVYVSKNSRDASSFPGQTWRARKLIAANFN